MRNNHQSILESESIIQKEKFTLQEFRKKLLNWIVIDDQPFTVVEGQKFKDMLSFLKFDLIIPSADTLRCDLDVIFTQTKENIYQILQVIIVINKLIIIIKY